MGQGIITRLLSSLEETSAELPDNRKAGNGTKYQVADALKSMCQNGKHRDIKKPTGLFPVFLSTGG
jgi:hypothetical protein